MSRKEQTRQMKGEAREFWGAILQQLQETWIAKIPLIGQTGWAENVTYELISGCPVYLNREEWLVTWITVSHKSGAAKSHIWSKVSRYWLFDLFYQSIMQTTCRGKAGFFHFGKQLELQGSGPYLTWCMHGAHHFWECGCPTQVLLEVPRLLYFIYLFLNAADFFSRWAAFACVQSVLLINAKFERFERSVQRYTSFVWERIASCMLLICSL